MTDTFYRHFEDRHRGSSQDIGRRLQVYLPFVLPLVSCLGSVKCLDLGCGRGEWLHLLTEHGVRVDGVDLDDAMLDVARGQGLHVNQQDALQALRDAADQSIAVITAFHLVEHLSFQDTQVLVAEAHRALVPGGVLILETPNPDNLIVATCNFHLDPSHIKPIPGLLLSFLAEQTGFNRCKIIGLQESPSLYHKSKFDIQDVLAGASPDYAVLAQKGGPTTCFNAIDAAFNRNYGMSTAEIARAYAEQEAKSERAVQEVQKRLQDSLCEMNSALERIAKLEAEILAIQKSMLGRPKRLILWLIQQFGRLQEEGFQARLGALKKKLGWRRSGIELHNNLEHDACTPNACTDIASDRGYEDREISERTRQLSEQLDPGLHRPH